MPPPDPRLLEQANRKQLLAELNPKPRDPFAGGLGELVGGEGVASVGFGARRGAQPQPPSILSAGSAGGSQIGSQIGGGSQCGCKGGGGSQRGSAGSQISVARGSRISVARGNRSAWHGASRASAVKEASAATNQARPPTTVTRARRFRASRRCPGARLLPFAHRSPQRLRATRLPSCSCG